MTADLEVKQKEDGHWLAEIPSWHGVMAYGTATAAAGRPSWGGDAPLDSQESGVHLSR
jgi:hypothetical protein